MNADLIDFRTQIDDFLQSHPQSPLEVEDRGRFKGLNYYPENEALVLEVDINRLPESEPLIVMETNTGQQQQYRRWGQFTFVVDGETATLTIYSDAHGHDFFMPFKDATNGQETYGAGRYLDNHRPGLVQLADTCFKVDFNYAYNPYCAYSPYFSCPLPPRENWLKVPVQAGEKDFKSVLQQSG